VYITSIQIENYKSYWESEEIEFAKGFNVIVGANNAGKTSLLECLSLTIVNDPHLSLKTKQNEHASVEKDLKLKVAFQVTSEDFTRVTRGLDTFTLYFPLGVHETVVIKDYEQYIISGSFPRIIAEMGNSSSIINVAFDYVNYQDTLNSNAAITFRKDDSSNKWRGGGTDTINKVRGNSIEKRLLQWLMSEIYMFKAERLNISQSSVLANKTLKPDASNLPEVLQNLRNDSNHVYQRYLRAIQEIFPEITDVAPNTTGAGTSQILIWTTDPTQDRQDLAQPLSKSGTGIGQVLAMLYVLFTSKYPRIILIDEPQSFLHPGAIRNLFEIFKRHKVKHQYIVTTHSPLVITAANPERIILLQKEDAETKVYPINKSEKAEMEMVLHSVGAGLSDVFGAENVLWVEGQTETKCYPLIIRELCESPLLGTTVVEVQHTGDFEDDKKVQQVKPLYEKLTQGNALIPPAVGFIFDRETKTQKKVADMERMGIKFLKRRMYENYLLNPSAIASVLSQSPYLQGKQFTLKQVVDWFDNNLWEMVSGVKQWNKKYFDKFPSSLELDDEALTLIHGANVLNDLFVELTGDTPLEYYKIEHGYELTEWLVANDKAALNEVKELLDNCLGKKP
jgi:energy-coupling factor transporter ATP-binding protein EcfA2